MTKKRKKDIELNSNFFENTLVRFRTISLNNVDNLKSDILYYSTPKNFNDPYDTLIYANYLQIIKDVYYNLKTGMDSYLEGIIKKSPLLEADVYALWYGSNRNEILDMFLEQIFNYIKMIQEDLRNKTKIICFTEEYLSMLMWSHYADSHKGFAIIYDRNNIENADNFTCTGDLIRKKPILRQVTYNQQQSDLTYEIEDYIRAYRMTSLGDVVPPIPNLSQDKLRKMITEKSPDWSYEKEWRLIPRHISLENESNLGYMCIKPKGVIIGSMCVEDYQYQLIDICDEKMIPVFKTELNCCEPGYKLELMRP